MWVHKFVAPPVPLPLKKRVRGDTRIRKEEGEGSGELNWWLGCGPCCFRHLWALEVGAGSKLDGQ